MMRFVKKIMGPVEHWHDEESGKGELRSTSNWDEKNPGSQLVCGFKYGNEGTILKAARYVGANSRHQKAVKNYFDEHGQKYA